MNDNMSMQVALLSSYTTNPDLFEPCAHLIRKQLWTDPVYQKCFEIIDKHHKEGRAIDSSILSKSFKGDRDAVIKISNLAGGYLPPKTVVEYITTLFDDYMSRYLIERLSATLIDLKDGTDPLECMNSAKDVITNVELVLNNITKEKSSQVIFDETIQRIRDLKSGAIKQSGFPFGITELDRKTGGIPAGITVLAGAKGGGKTSALVNIIRVNAIENQTPVLFFSMEMKAQDIMINLMANYKEINSRALREGNVDDEQIQSLYDLKKKLSDNFTIDETGGITWQYFETKVRAFRKKHKIPLSQPILVMLDYLQLMKNTPDEMRMSKEERVEHICSELMRICKNEHISLVKLCQFSRDIDKRGSNSKYFKKDDPDNEALLDAIRPVMSDLKGSGAIEANAVMILLLFRPEYHGIKTGKDGRDLSGLCEINIAKSRFTKPEPVYARFWGKYSKFTDADTEKNDIQMGPEGAF